MPKRMAITIAGAVSLGSYEAGVLYEVLEALRRHNSTAKSEDDKIYVDAITGASAGGMTAAMAAQRLLYDADDLTGANTNVFYQAWVARISLQGLQLQPMEDIWDSLLSSNVIESLGKEFLLDSLDALQPPKQTKVHPAVEVERDGSGQPKLDANGNQKPKPLFLGLALTNLDGLDYGYPILADPPEKFQYTRCVDQMWRDVAVSVGAAVDVWGTLKEAAVASGAFPFAFRVKDIERLRGEYPQTSNETLQNWPVDDHGNPEPKTFAYTDGGVLQNQPLGLAKNLVDMLVQERVDSGDLTAHNDADNRLYLFVSPHSLQSGTSDFSANEANFRRMAHELLLTYIHQAEFHDWIMAEQVNQQVDLLDTRAEGLAHTFIGNADSSDVAALKKLTIQLAPLLNAGETEPQKQTDRLKHQYADLYDAVLKKGQGTADAWVNAVSTLESAASLQKRDRMNILGVTANGSQDLAGAGIAAFAGFFSKSYREHDYIVGRNKARQYLAKPMVQKILGIRDLEKGNVPDDSGITMPIRKRDLWRTGGPTICSMLIHRIFRWWPSALGALGTLGLIVAAIWWFLRR
jgi:predicted acylesterase/phospholipase RssA